MCQSGSPTFTPWCAPQTQSLSSSSNPFLRLSASLVSSFPSALPNPHFLQQALHLSNHIWSSYKREMRLHPTPSHLLLQEDQSRLQGTFRRLAPKTFLDTSCTDLLSWHCTPPPAQLCQRCPVGRSPHRPPHVSCTDCPWPSNTTLKIVAQQPHRGSTTLTPCANWLVDRDTGSQNNKDLER